MVGSFLPPVPEHGASCTQPETRGAVADAHQRRSHSPILSGTSGKSQSTGSGKTGKRYRSAEEHRSNVGHYQTQFLPGYQWCTILREWIPAKFHAIWWCYASPDDTPATTNGPVGPVNLATRIRLHAIGES